MRFIIITTLILVSLPTFSQELGHDLQHLRNLAKEDKMNEAVGRALIYLAEQQDETSGAFNQHKLPNTMTALSALAFMANGHLPNQGKYSKVVHKAILYLADKSDKDKGYFGNEGKGRMYTHGICTLALAEAYGMMPTIDENKRIGKCLKRSVDIITQAQVKRRGRNYGGWHYEPKSASADLSVSFWQILALRSALNCSINVPTDVIKHATNYVRNSYMDKVQTFTYNGKRVTPPIRSSGSIALLALGAGTSEKDKRMIRNAASSLINYNPAQGEHFYCQSFSLAVSCNMLGDTYINPIRPKLEAALLGQQEKDGSFKKHTGAYAGVYSTAFAVISLSIKRQLLPITQN